MLDSAVPRGNHMTKRSLLALAAVLAAAPAARAEDETPRTYEAYQRASSLTCVGDPGFTLPAPEAFEAHGFTVEVRGAVAKLRRKGASPHAGKARLGVLAGIKDLEPATKRSLDAFYAEFEKQGVDAVLVGGDTAYGELELEDILSYLGEKKLPVIAIMGNNESRSAFNRATLAAWKKHPLVLNGNLLRRVDGDGFDVVSLGGYHDKAFASTSGACLYRDADVAALAGLAAQADDPVVLLLHGPPKGEGKAAIDFVPGSAGNVGDVRLTKAIAGAKIPVVVAGHILEAGARATDGSGKKAVPEGKAAKTLFLNPGQANSLPYSLSLGWTSYGTAAIVELGGGQASWKLLKAERPAAP